MHGGAKPASFCTGFTRNARIFRVFRQIIYPDPRPRHPFIGCWAQNRKKPGKTVILAKNTSKQAIFAKSGCCTVWKWPFRGSATYRGLSLSVYPLVFKPKEAQWRAVLGCGAVVYGRTGREGGAVWWGTRGGYGGGYMGVVGTGRGMGVAKAVPVQASTGPNMAKWRQIQLNCAKYS